MTNADKPKTYKDKYLKDGVDVEELSNGIVMFEVKKIGWQIAEKGKDRIKRFFEQSIKPTLTEDEKVILRNIEVQRTYDKYITIKREDKFTLVAIGECGTIGNLSMYAHLFQFIQPRRRI